MSPAIASDVASNKLAIASNVASNKLAIASNIASDKSVIASNITSNRRSYCQQHTALLAILLAIGDVASNVAGNTRRCWQHCWQQDGSLAILLVTQRIAGNIAGNKRRHWQPCWQHEELLAMLLAIWGVAGDIAGNTEHDWQPHYSISSSGWHNNWQSCKSLATLPVIGTLAGDCHLLVTLSVTAIKPAADILTSYTAGHPTSHWQYCQLLAYIASDVIESYRGKE